MTATTNYAELIKKAREAMTKSYSPYSRFAVGCAIQYKDGHVTQGTNIENVSFGATNCAERTALFAGVMAGYQPDDVDTIVVAASGKGYISPCSICRQVMVELCRPDTTVVMLDENDNYRISTVQELVPFSFSEMT